MQFVRILPSSLAATSLLFTSLTIHSANPPSSHTIQKNTEQLSEFNFDNKDIEQVNKGFIAPLNNAGVISDAASKIVWDLTQFDFIKKYAAKDAPKTVNPSLWHQSELMLKNGLFKVVDGVYQVRNADISNMTIIEGKTGIIIVDPLISKETAKVALDLYYAHRPKKPVRAVIYTHTHIDHYGGVRGVVDEADVKAGKVAIYAPKGFAKAALSENIFVGNHMMRRAMYSYGAVLPKNAEGNVGAGLGITNSMGTVTFLSPTDSIKKSFETRIIDGVEVQFMLSPGAEAPEEMMFFLPQFKALCVAEEASHTMHNVYTLRGAKVRDARAWAFYINEAVEKFGEKTQVVFAQHQWPTWGHDEAIDYLESQRDMYQYLHDQTMRLANHGYNMIEASELMTMPTSLSSKSYNRGYYGSVNHNTKGVWNYYLGWFDSDPANLHPLGTVEAAKKTVEYMGGEDAIMALAKKDYDAGNYRWVATVVHNIVYANPNNTQAKNLLADAYEQMGYQTENGTWRNHYLMGAMELRDGVKKIPMTHSASSDTIRAMDSSMLFDYLAIQLNGPKADGKVLTFNINMPDTKEKFLLQLKNGVLHHYEGKNSPTADAVITVDREILNQVFERKTSLFAAEKQGKAKFSGNMEKFKELLAMLDTFEFWWPIATPRTAA